MEKAEARRQIQELIEGLTPAERAAKSQAIRKRFGELEEVRAAQTVLGFMPMPDEVDTRPILEDLLAAGKRVFLPRSSKEDRCIIPIRLRSLDALREGMYGILEPDSEETCSPSELDVIMVPARGFDQQGNRLGRGAGYYDRFMAQSGFRALRCGVAFACQVLPEIPCAPHDLPVQLLVTESETLRL